MTCAARTGAETMYQKWCHAWTLFPEFWTLLKARRGILSLSFILMMVNRLSGLVLPVATKYVIDDVIGKRQIHILIPIVLVVFAGTVVQGLTLFTMTQLLSKSGQKMIAELRLRVQAHIGRLPLSFYDANKTGSLVTRIISDVMDVQNLVGTGLIDLVGTIVTAVLALAVLFRISPGMTLAACALLIAFGFGLKRAYRVANPFYRLGPRIHAEVGGRLTESLNGVRVVKGYHGEKSEESTFAVGVQKLLDNFMRTLTITSFMGLSATCLTGFMSALIMLIGTYQVLSGTLTLGTFLTFTILLAMLVSPVMQIVAYGPHIARALVGLERTREVLNEKPEDDSPRRTVRFNRIRGQVVFDKVEFAYDPGNPVLHDVSFEADPGTVTALVGPSGAGKSTTVALIAAFYTPTIGRIMVDGLDLSLARLDSYRTQLGLVLQETFLFDDTIRANVSFARPHASNQEILRACRVAGVDEFAETFERKYDTIVGERGVKLSGGQKQRVSIARAILADPRVLILDEATSSLDSESEALIQEGLRYLMRGRTTFVIAHRLSTIRLADQILVFERGRIVERGTHESLFARRGRYHELYTRQHSLRADLFLTPGERDIEPGTSQATVGR